MKKLGLIGGIGPESTIVYYREILHKVHSETGNFPNLAVESLSCFDIFELCGKGDLAGLASYVGRGVANLAAAGCDFVALCGNTPNIVLPELKENSTMPIISSVDCSLNFAKQNGLKRLILLGTKFTMRADFFQRAFEPAGIKIYVPNDDKIELIAHKIESEIELGIVKDETRAEILAIVERLRAQYDADGVILGCTELPLLFEGYKFNIVSLDTMRIHIDTLAKMIINKEQK